MNNTFVCQLIIESIHVNQNSDELWESIVLDRFPNTSKQKLVEAKINASIAWYCGEKSAMSELYDKYVMVKRLKGVEPKKEEN